MRMTRLFHLSLCLLLVAQTSLQKSIKLGKHIILEWKADRSKGMASMKVRAVMGPQDWVGVGFSSYGSLTEADMCLLWRDWKGGTKLTDIKTDRDSLVVEDAKNDCLGAKWRKKRMKDGQEEVEYLYTRQLDTCDDMDYKLEEGTTHVVWALGRGPLYGISGVNISDTATVETGMTRVRYLGISPESMDDTVVPYSITGKDVTLPATDTMYWCSVHRLDTQFSSKHHVVQYEADISPGSEDVVHHMEVFHCPRPEQGEFPVWAGSCADEKAPKQLTQCKKVLAAWAIGAGPFTYPKQAGMAIGGEDFHPFVMLEVHYNNPDKRSGIIDSSGIKFHITADLRPHDAGIMELGLIYNNWMAVPPHTAQFPLTGTCVPQCTAVGLPSRGIVVFGSQLHTHGAGRQVRTTVLRNGKEHLLNEDRHYSTHFQEIRVLHSQVSVLPGDALITTCMYNTLDRENITLGGFGFTEEMCVNYIHYYPRAQLEVCKSSIDKDQLYRYFNDLSVEENQNTGSEKSIEENYRSICWNRKRTNELKAFYQRRTLSMQCMMSGGDSFPGRWNDIPQPDVKEEYTATNPCKEDASHKDNEGSSEVWNAENVKKPSENYSKKKGSLRKSMKNKRFFNSYEDEWADYTSWGVDKRSDIIPEHDGDEPNYKLKEGKSKLI